MTPSAPIPFPSRSLDAHKGTFGHVVVVAGSLGAQWPNRTDRAGVRAVCRRESNAVRALLAGFPSYFMVVASELGR